MVTAALRRVQGEQENRVRTAVNAVGSGGLIERSVALDALIEGLIEALGEPFQPVLRAIGISGTLPQMVIGLEQVHGGINPSEGPEILGRLREIEYGFSERMERVRSLSYGDKVDYLKDRLRKRRYVMSRRAQHLYNRRTDSRFIDGFFYSANIADYLLENYPPEAFPKRRFPSRFSDFLMRRSGVSPISGHCYSIHLIAAHLAHLVGRRYSLLSYPEHVNLLEEKSGLVINLNSTFLHVSVLDDWRDAGLYGPNQKPAPPEAFLSGDLVSLLNQQGSDEERAYKLYRAAVAVYPEEPNFQLGLASFTPDPIVRKEIYQRAIKLNPRNPSTHISYGKFLHSQRRFGEARAEYLLALQWDEKNKNRRIQLRMEGFRSLSLMVRFRIRMTIALLPLAERGKRKRLG